MIGESVKQILVHLCHADHTCMTVVPCFKTYMVSMFPSISARAALHLTNSPPTCLF